MLSGIGGRTISEAKTRITIAEFNQWAAYRLKRGSFNVGMRVEHSIAALSALYANSKSSKSYRSYDFAEHEDEPVESLESAMSTWL